MFCKPPEFFSKKYVKTAHGKRVTAKFLDKPSEQSPDSPSRKKKQTRLFCSSLDFSYLCSLITHNNGNKDTRP